MNKTLGINQNHIYVPTTDDAQKRERLFEIIKERSYINDGPITLTSGKVSDYYINTKPTMMCAEGAYLIATLVLDAVKDIDANLIGGLEMGAVPLAASVAAVSQSENRPLDAFFVRKQAKSHGTKNLVEGLVKDDTMSGKKVIIIEDVTTTGGSAIKAAETLKSEGATIAQVVTVIDRQEGALEAFKEAQLPFIALFGANEFK